MKRSMKIEAIARLRFTNICLEKAATPHFRGRSHFMGERQTRDAQGQPQATPGKS
jgi:hypothetical protein